MVLAEDREGIVVAWLRDHVLFLLQSKLCVCVCVSVFSHGITDKDFPANVREFVLT